MDLNTLYNAYVNNAQSYIDGANKCVATNFAYEGDKFEIDIKDTTGVLGHYTAGIILGSTLFDVVRKGKVTQAVVLTTVAIAPLMTIPTNDCKNVAIRGMALLCGIVSAPVFLGIIGVSRMKH